MGERDEREADVPWRPFAVAGAIFSLVVTYFCTLALHRPLIDFVGFGFIVLLLCPVGFLLLGWLVSVNPLLGAQRLLWTAALFVWGTAWVVYLITIAYQFHQRDEYCPVPLTVGGQREPGDWQYFPPFASCPPDGVAWWASALALVVLGCPLIVFARRVHAGRRHGVSVRTG